MRVAQAMENIELIQAPQTTTTSGGSGSGVRPASELQQLSPRVVEVGCGDGGFAAYMRQGISLESLSQLDFVATDATSPQDHDDVCKLAVQANIPSFHSVSANNLEAYLAPESVEIILSVNPYGYGLGKDCESRDFYRTSSYDWAFLASAMKVLRPGGCVMMLVQSNLMSDYFNYLEFKGGTFPLSQDELYEHNKNALGSDVVIGHKEIEWKGGSKIFRYDRQGKDRLGKLLVSNTYGPHGYTQLVEIAKTPLACQSGQCVFLPMFRLVLPPKNVTFRAFDDQTVTRPDIRGFNIMIVLVKNWYSSTVAPHPPICGGIPDYHWLTSYLLTKGWTPKQLNWDDETI